MPDQTFHRVEAGAHKGAYGLNAIPEPTEAQAIAGNYKMGRIALHGLKIAIEQPRGTYRTGVDEKTGKRWTSRMAAHYGYISGTRGADGDGVDCFVGPVPQSDRVFIVNQFVRGAFDEHKVMLGYMEAEDAERAYRNSYDRGWSGLESLIPCSMTQFKWWLKHGDKRRPVRADSLPFEGLEDMTNPNVRWNADAQPEGRTLDHVLYDLRRADAGEGLLFDSVSLADILEDSDGVLALDAMVLPFAKLEPKMNQLYGILTRTGGEVKPVAMQITEPFKQRGVANVAVLFELSDGQTLSIYFHNPDVTPQKMAPADELISWKWLLNKKDVSIVVAPERGQDLNPREVARRILKLAEKNSAAFQRANAKRAETMGRIDGLKTEISALETELKDVQHELEVAKVEAETKPHPYAKFFELQKQADGASWGVGNPNYYGVIQDEMGELPDDFMPEANNKQMAMGMGEMVAEFGDAFAVQINVNKDKPFRVIKALYPDGRGVGSQWAATADEAYQMVKDAPVLTTIKPEAIDPTSPEGYAKVMVNPALQAKFADVLDAFFQERVIAVRNALRELGWDGEKYAWPMTKAGASLDVAFSYADAARNVSGEFFKLSGSASGSVADGLTKTPEQLAAEIDAMVPAANIEPEQPGNPDGLTDAEMVVLIATIGYKPSFRWQQAARGTRGNGDEGISRGEYESALDSLIASGKYIKRNSAITPEGTALVKAFRPEIPFADGKIRQFAGKFKSDPSEAMDRIAAIAAELEKLGWSKATMSGGYAVTNPAGTNEVAIIVDPVYPKAIELRGTNATELPAMTPAQVAVEIDRDDVLNEYSIGIDAGDQIDPEESSGEYGELFAHKPVAFAHAGIVLEKAVKARGGVILWGDFNSTLKAGSLFDSAIVGVTAQIGLNGRVTGRAEIDEAGKVTLYRGAAGEEVIGAAESVADVPALVNAMFDEEPAKKEEPAPDPRELQNAAFIAVFDALVSNHGWNRADGTPGGTFIGSVKKMFDGLGPKGTMITPNGERQITVWNRQGGNLVAQLGDTIIADESVEVGGDYPAIAAKINAAVDVFADAERKKRNPEPPPAEDTKFKAKFGMTVEQAKAMLLISSKWSKSAGRVLWYAEDAAATPFNTAGEALEHYMTVVKPAREAQEKAADAEGFNAATQSAIEGKTIAVAKVGDAFYMVNPKSGDIQEGGSTMRSKWFAAESEFGIEVMQVGSVENINKVSLAIKAKAAPQPEPIHVPEQNDLTALNALKRAAPVGPIKSDDPDAIEKLRAKVAYLSAYSTMMTKANKFVRKEDRAGLAAMGFSGAVLEGLFKPDFSGRKGFPDYEMTNNNAEIRRANGRLAELEKALMRTEEKQPEPSGSGANDGPGSAKITDFAAATDAELDARYRFLLEKIDRSNKNKTSDVSNEELDEYSDVLEEQSNRRNGVSSADAAAENKWFETRERAEEYLAKIGYKNSGDHYAKAGKPNAKIVEEGVGRGGFSVVVDDFTPEIEAMITEAAQLAGKTRPETKSLYENILSERGKAEADRLLAATIDARKTNPAKAADRALMQSVIDGSTDPLSVDLDALEAAYTRNADDAEIAALFEQAVAVVLAAEDNATKGA